MDRVTKFLLGGIAVALWTYLAVFIATRNRIERPTPEGQLLLRVSARLADVGEDVHALKSQVDNLQTMVLLRCREK